MPRLIDDFTAAAFTQPSQQDIGQTIRDAVQEASQEAAREARQQAREAQQRVREAQQEIREAQQRVREAQQEVREAQQHVREATTADQRGAAEQEVFGAQEQVKEAEQALRQLERTTKSPPFVFTSQPPFQSQPTIPGEAVDIAIGFFITCAVIIVGWPIARALGRRFERRGAPPAVEAGMTDQLQRIEQAVEAIAIEVERISESQRFLAKLQEKSPAALE
jgi:cation transport ATPase